MEDELELEPDLEEDLDECSEDADGLDEEEEVVLPAAAAAVAFAFSFSFSLSAFIFASFSASGSEGFPADELDAVTGLAEDEEPPEVAANVDEVCGCTIVRGGLSSWETS